MPRSNENDTQPDPGRAPSTDPGLAPAAAGGVLVSRRGTAIGLGSPVQEGALDASDSERASATTGDLSNPNPVPVDDLLSALAKKTSDVERVQARQTSGERAAAYDVPAQAPPAAHDTAPPERSIVLDIPTDPSRRPAVEIMEVESRQAPTVVTRPRAKLPVWTFPLALGLALMLTFVGWLMFHDEPPTAPVRSSGVAAGTPSAAVASPPRPSATPATPEVATSERAPALAPSAEVSAASRPPTPPRAPAPAVPAPKASAKPPASPSPAQSAPQPPMDLLGPSH